MINFILWLNEQSKTVTVFFRTPAGMTVKILVMSLVSSVGITLYFFIVFDGRVGSQVLSKDFIKFIGVLFALSVASGSYVCALNNMRKLGATLFLIDGLISWASYSAIFLEQIPTTILSIEALPFHISIVISTAMAWTPAIMVLGYSHKLNEMILADKNDSKTFDLIQEIDDKNFESKRDIALGKMKPDNKNDFDLDFNLN